MHSYHRNQQKEIRRQNKTAGRARQTVFYDMQQPRQQQAKMELLKKIDGGNTTNIITNTSNNQPPIVTTQKTNKPISRNEELAFKIAEGV